MVSSPGTCTAVRERNKRGFPVDSRDRGRSWRTGALLRPSGRLPSEGVWKWKKWDDDVPDRTGSMRRHIQFQTLY